MLMALSFPCQYRGMHTRIHTYDRLCIHVDKWIDRWMDLGWMDEFQLMFMKSRQNPSVVCGRLFCVVIKKKMFVFM